MHNLLCSQPFIPYSMNSNQLSQNCIELTSCIHSRPKSFAGLEDSFMPTNLSAMSQMSPNCYYNRNEGQHIREGQYSGEPHVRLRLPSSSIHHQSQQADLSTTQSTPHLNMLEQDHSRAGAVVPDQPQSPIEHTYNPNQYNPNYLTMLQQTLAAPNSTAFLSSVLCCVYLLFSFILAFFFRCWL